MRNRWVLAIAILLAAFALTLAFLGSAPAGETKANALAITVVSLATLNIYLIPLIALLLSYDAIVGEIERGTMALLLSYPLSRWQVVAGKFLGQTAILAVAIAIGYFVAGIAVALLHKIPGFLGGLAALFQNDIHHAITRRRLFGDWLCVKRHCQTARQRGGHGDWRLAVFCAAL